LGYFKEIYGIDSDEDVKIILNIMMWYNIPEGINIHRQTEKI
jgi:hypothetical protein